MKRPVTMLSIVAAIVLVGATGASADTVGPITFEPTAYTLGPINGQNGWTDTGGYDANVVALSAYPAASSYGFGAQALQVSNKTASGSFSDQTFAPPLADPAGESTGDNQFDASFSIGTALSTEQAGLTLSVSPDDGTGNRMSYLRFEDQADGVHVFFDDATDPGPLGTQATFNESDIATLDRSHAHTIMFSLTFVPGAANDVVRVYIDGVLKATGTTWEDYYRYDPEQTGNGNVVPTTSTLLFRESGTAVAGNGGNGFLIDNVTMSSSNTGAPASGKSMCKRGGWRTFSNPWFRNQGQCVKYMVHQDKHDKHHHPTPKGPKHVNQSASKSQGKSDKGKSHGKSGKDRE
jgi:hypothetical protein